MISYQKNGFEFTAIDYPFYVLDAIQIRTDIHSVEKYVDFINKHEISKAYVISDNLGFITSCPSLKQLKIHPNYLSDKSFDFSPLYKHPQIKQLNCVNVVNNKYIIPIDFSQIIGLEDLSFGFNKGCLNFNKIDTLKSMSVGGYVSPQKDLSDLFCSEKLDTLELRQCSEYSLNGIEASKNLTCLYIYYNRNLEDISALKSCAETLRTLRIQSCPKIKDFSVLSELKNIELLELTGSNELPDLSFIEQMPNLKTFVFNVNVKDGDLSPCLRLSYVYSEKNRKHYNLKDNALPKGECIRGNESIDEWRRLE